MINPEIKKNVTIRLKKIKGQVQGIEKMVEDEKYCIDILNQITAIKGALNQVSHMLIRGHISNCVANAIKYSNKSNQLKKIEELMEVLSKV